MASVDINIVGAVAPFTYSIKDTNQIERFTSYSNGKLYFNEIQDGQNHEYTVTVSKDNCVVTNTILLYNCNSIVSPVPVVPVVCVAPSLSFVNKSDKTIGFSIADSDTVNCAGYTFQWSLYSDFQFLNEQFVSSCNTSQFITVPTYAIWFFRIKKKCNDNSTVLSNTVSVNIQQPVVPVPVPINTCANSCDLYSIYSESSWQIQYLNCDGISQQLSGNPFGSYQVCACSGTINTISGNPLITLVQTGGCNTPTPVPVPVPIPTPVSTTCKEILFRIELSDLQNSDGGVVFVTYKNCNGVTVNTTFNNNGVFYFCCNGQAQYVSLYNYVNGAINFSLSSGYTISTTQCTDSDFV